MLPGRPGAANRGGQRSMVEGGTQVRRFLLVTSLLLIPTLVLGQAMTTGRVKGTVIDEEGNAVAGARVVFISSSLQGERVLTTADNGKFLAAILPIGPYSVEISAPAASSLRTHEAAPSASGPLRESSSK